MPFDWRDFLIVAHEQRHDQREGIQRTSLGRTYYYIYNFGLTKARAQNFSTVQGQGGMHENNWRHENSPRECSEPSKPFRPGQTPCC